MRVSESTHRRLRRRVLSLGLCFGLTLLLPACAARSVDPGQLAITAHQAWNEARVQARGWASDAQLQFVEGAAVTHEGTVRADAGYWRFVYRSPSRADQFAVTIRPTAVEGAERAPQSPPGYVLGNETLGVDWIDSREALANAPAFGEGTRVPMVLVPTSPPRWIIELPDEPPLEVNATTGAVIR